MADESLIADRHRARRLGAAPGRGAGRHRLLRRARRDDGLPASSRRTCRASDRGSARRPSLGDLILGWDARWYWIVAETGYPTELPLTDSGAVAENQWAFMPVYAYLAKLVSLPFGGQWVVGAFLVSIVAGYAASFVLYRMMRERMDADAAMWAVAFFAAGPLAALFQVGYAESLFLLWLFLALWCVHAAAVRRGCTCSSR